MKKIFKIIGITSILLFSFYYTEKVNNIVINNSSLMNEINEVSEYYNISSKDATIDDIYIIPGLNGYSVNVLKSYNNMRHINTFNESLLEYDVIKPEVSLNNHKDKIINSGNKYKNNVSIIVKDNNEIIDYSINNNINITRLININNISNKIKYEQINNDIYNYKNVENILNKYNLNTNICYYKDNIRELCKDKYLVKENLVLNNSNISDIKNKIQNGSIIYITDNVTLSDYKILIKQIYYKDLNILHLSKLISEER